MSKYNALWDYIKRNGKETFRMTFDEIQSVSGIAIDHSFLQYKKELIAYGYRVEKISLKEHTVLFVRTDAPLVGGDVDNTKA